MENERGEWLASLKVGDKVIVEIGSGAYLTTVEKLTPALIWVDCKYSRPRFNRFTGESSTWGKIYPDECPDDTRTPEEVAADECAEAIEEQRIVASRDRANDRTGYYDRALYAEGWDVAHPATG